jgi:hypothetical protein
MVGAGENEGCEVLEESVSEALPGVGPLLDDGHKLDVRERRECQSEAIGSTVALACRLRPRGSTPAGGEVEIENVSQDVVEIEVTMHPLQYLELLITDAVGEPVAAPPYGHIFSPRERPYVLRLAPGEKYVHNVGLLGNVPEERRLPGTYTVRAVYEYDGLRAVSDLLRVSLPPVNDRQ